MSPTAQYKLLDPKYRRLIDDGTTGWAFTDWLAGATGRLARHLRVTAAEPARGVVDLTIVTRRASLHGAVSNNEVVVFAERNGECWDRLLSLACRPSLGPDGRFVSSLCAVADREGFADRRALWAHYLFEPFLTWLNESLAPATQIAFYRSNGATWANLSSESSPDLPAAVMPL